MVWALETSDLTLSDTPPPTQSHVRLSKWFQQLGVNYLKAWVCRGHSHLNPQSSCHHGKFCHWVVSGALEMVAVAERIPGCLPCVFPSGICSSDCQESSQTPSLWNLKRKNTCGDIDYETQVDPRMGRWSWHAVLGWFNIKTKFWLPFCHIHTKAIDID